ncbi:MAG TPA: hypothetical protein ENF93_00615 [Ignisphaera sp.]|nr:hypothetical protein [Ignisphaera sp.]
MKIKKRIDIEELGLDLSKLTEEELYKIAEIAEVEIRKALDEVLGPRIIKYLLIVNVFIDDKLNVFVDLSTDSHVPPAISLENVLDRAIKRGLDKAAAYVRTLAREIKEGIRESTEHSHINA